MSAPASRLSPFQTEVLDLFTLVGPLTDGAEALRDLARAIGARGEDVRTSPEFRRFVLSRGDESLESIASSRSPDRRGAARAMALAVFG